GEQQRLAIARAWALRPELLFLDEPTSQLDPAATRQIETLLAGLVAEGITVLMSTHDLGQARRLASRVLFLHRGRLIADAPATDFFADPGLPEARAFLAGELIW
ncbi:ATP-binding cassette domain-containing protein, partial [Bosea sp. (in: a-proteobacteria)]|uniref:ATP-binding cassette domain-containing protein n=1 Tax=Bosea sp. (in: a-proteobacteria) TaxID=1871050 RepID=UPI0027369E1D